MTSATSGTNITGKRFSDYCPFCGQKPLNLTDHIREHILEEDSKKNSNDSTCLPNESNTSEVVQNTQKQVPEVINKRKREEDYVNINNPREVFPNTHEQDPGVFKKGKRELNYDNVNASTPSEGVPNTEERVPGVFKKMKRERNGVNNPNEVVRNTQEEQKLPDDPLTNLEPVVYDCEICGGSFKDFGAHLCFSHGMVKCGQEEHSNMYFEDNGELEKHMMEFHIEKKETCSICWLVGAETKFPDLYALIEHKKTFHGLDLCVLCKYNSTNGEEFCKHMKTHNITNRDVLNNEINEPLLLNNALANFNKVNMVVSCGLCGNRNATSKLLDYANKKIDVSDGGNRLWKHFMLIHKIKNPHLVFLPIFNGLEFGFKNLKFSVVKEEDIEFTKEANVDLLKPNEISLKIKEEVGSVNNGDVLDLSTSNSFLGPSQVVNLNFNKNISFMGPGVQILQGTSDPPRYVASIEESEILRTLDKCDVCSQISGRRGGIFKRHMEADHENIKFKECSKCHFIAFNNFKINQHADRVHVKSVCSKCGLEKKRLKIHIKTCSGEPQNEEEDFNYDNFIAIENKIFTCLHCGLKFDLYMKAYVHVYNLKKIGQLINPEENEDNNDMLKNRSIGQLLNPEENKDKNDMLISNNIEMEAKNKIRSWMRKKVGPTRGEYWPRFACSQCNLPCSSNRDRASHEQQVHSQHYTQEQRECKYCAQEFDSISHKKSHERRHVSCLIEKSKNFKCNECEKEFQYRDRLYSHLNYIHSDVADIACADCPKKFKSENNLKAHFNRKHNPDKELKYACVECDKRFFNNSDRAVHMIKHTNVRSYPCDLCGKFFKRPTDVTKHKQTKHSNLKPYYCEYCQRSFSQSSNLYTHQKRQHFDDGIGIKRRNKAAIKSGETLLEIKEEKSVGPNDVNFIGPNDENFVPKINSYNSSSMVKSRIAKGLDDCDICKQIYGRRGGLFKRHVMSDHPSVAFKECSKCNFIAFQDLKITQHAERVHVNSVCSKCGLEKKRLNVHIKTCTGQPEKTPEDINCEDFINIDNNIFSCVHCEAKFDLYMKAYVHVYTISRTGDLNISQSQEIKDGDL